VASLAGLDALLVCAPASVRYLSGFTGSNGWLLVGGGARLLITDARYEEQADLEAPAYTTVVARPALAPALLQHLPAGVVRIGLDPASVSHSTWRKLTHESHVQWVYVEGLVAAIRSVKEPQEVRRIRRALMLAEAVLCDVVAQIHPGMTELQVAARLDYECRTRGATAMAFDTIVAAGVRGALPHARPSETVLMIGDLLVVDFGCVVDGYCSDITRAVLVGDDLSDDWQEVHSAVDEARAAAVSAIAPGVATSEVDRVAREALARAGLAEDFNHSLGHGVGLEVHEGPRLSARSEDELVAGMVVTVEPGVYLSGRGGVRLEDMVLVTDEGRERLNRLDTAILRTATGG
jgi:Xaa-Pro aminopeptidase